MNEMLHMKTQNSRRLDCRNSIHYPTSLSVKHRKKENIEGTLSKVQIIWDFPGFIAYMNTCMQSLVLYKKLTCRLYIVDDGNTEARYTRWLQNRKDMARNRSIGSILCCIFRFR